jgi:hypothetical protein
MKTYSNSETCTERRSRDFYPVSYIYHWSLFACDYLLGGRKICMNLVNYTLYNVLYNDSGGLQEIFRIPVWFRSKFYNHQRL